MDAMTLATSIFVSLIDINMVSYYWKKRYKFSNDQIHLGCLTSIIDYILIIVTNTIDFPVLNI